MKHDSQEFRTFIIPLIQSPEGISMSQKKLLSLLELQSLEDMSRDVHEALFKIMEDVFPIVENCDAMKSLSHLYRGRFLAIIGKLEDAEKELQRAYDIDGDNIRIRNTLAIVKAQLHGTIHGLLSACVPTESKNSKRLR